MSEWLKEHAWKAYLLNSGGRPHKLQIQMVASSRNHHQLAARGRPFLATSSHLGRPPASPPDSLSARFGARPEAGTRATLIDSAIYARGWSEDIICRETTLGAVEILVVESDIDLCEPISPHRGWHPARWSDLRSIPGRCDPITGCRGCAGTSTARASRLVVGKPW